MDRFLDVAQLSHSGKAASGEIDVQDIVFSHIQDAYTWHITEWNGQEIAIPLPILVKARKEDGIYSCHPIYIMADASQLLYRREGEHAGKVVEKNSAGEEVRPMDFSLTKNVCGLFLSCGLLLFIVLRTAHWYKSTRTRRGRIYRIDGNGHLLHTRRGDQRGDRKRI